MCASVNVETFVQMVGVCVYPSLIIIRPIHLCLALKQPNTQGSLGQRNNSQTHVFLPLNMPILTF